MMGTADNFRQYAADCVRQAEGEETPEDKNIMLNMALAWVRLAHQTQEFDAMLANQADESPAPAAEAPDDASIRMH